MISVGIGRLLCPAICICVLMVRRISRACPATASPRLGNICSVLMSFKVSQRTSFKLLAVSGLMTVTACLCAVRATAFLRFIAGVVFLTCFIVRDPFCDVFVEFA
jgi:hypothetical protein